MLAAAGIPHWLRRRLHGWAVISPARAKSGAGRYCHFREKRLARFTGRRPLSRLTSS